MKIFRNVLGVIIATIIGISCGSSTREISQDEKVSEKTDLYTISLLALNESDKIDLASFKGKYILFVNVASKCGYTPQYEGLEALYGVHKDNLIVIGLPCNQFGFQEPGDSTEIASFCKKNYGVTFPISEKLDVKGKNQHPVYQWLTQKKYNGIDDYKVSWNFNKFLVSPEGKLLKYFGSKVKPQSEDIVSLIK